MKIANRHLSISLQNDRLEIVNHKTGQKLRLDWPAVCVSFRGEEWRPTRAVGEPQASERSLRQSFEEGGLRFTVTLSLSTHAWFTKSVAISSNRKRPTPDLVEVDRQVLPADGLRLCGYQPSTPAEAKRSDEEGAGAMAGCGYPLIGKHFFVGLEHPAGFARVARQRGKETIWTRHHPVWAGKRLEQVDQVFGWADDARENFADYVDTMRLPALRKPLVSFCTFWSDPYLGDYEYRASAKGYEAYFRASHALGLTPDVFTLDAGWQDRQSVFQAKKEVGRDAGLLKLKRLAEKLGSGLSLWVSHNGYLGIDPGYMKKKAYVVGEGSGGGYSGAGFGVMMDRKFMDVVGARFCELASRIGAIHLKIDWDNHCATSRKFDRLYPTLNHVRQASVNAVSLIAERMRAATPNVATRNGPWTSPWWLRVGSHMSVADGGDSEFAALPSKTQRDAATTHRDLMYYNVLRRDKTPLPLDCWDNHEFPDAPRNPFPEDPGCWVNAAWLAFLRGTTYIPCKLMPESLEDWQADSLKQIMRFCRTYARHIYVPRGKMILGHPGRGEVYGFLQPGKSESWCVLRNPLPMPQTITFDVDDLTDHKVRTGWQFFPHYETFPGGGQITFLAHEVKVLILSDRKQKGPYSVPHMVEKDGRHYAYRFPASMPMSKSVRPLVDPIHRIDGLKCLDATKSKARGGRRHTWFLETPFRMRNLEVQFCLRGKDAENIKLRAFFSRSKGGTRGYAIPITTIPVGTPGYGETRNADVTCRPDETYYAIRVPDGGQFSLSLTLEGGPAKGALTSAWIAGYEAPSRNAVVRKSGPARFARCLPFQHPLGFGKALKLPVGEA